ncbi:MAG: hypothetical protein HW383_482 [Candidatus Magasanikbacteria bacterium]|nr:hypothetical protein [Candidatus Magasanikbacteria bacterium]
MNTNANKDVHKKIVSSKAIACGNSHREAKRREI